MRKKVKTMNTESVNNIDFALVTACDSRYFPLLRGLIRSLYDCFLVSDEDITNKNCSEIFKERGVNESSYTMKIYVLDGGLEPEEITWLAKRHVIIHSVEQFSLPVKPDTAKHKVGFLERHALPLMFPGHDIYMWMDADTWVQSFDKGMKPYLDKATKGYVVATPEYDRCFAFNPQNIEHSRGWAKGNYSKYFGDSLAESLYLQPMFNSGVFAAPGDSLFWKTWFAAMVVALSNNENKPEFGIDQITFNFVMYTAITSEFTIYPLPATCNWAVTHAMPVRDEDTGKLLTPLWPHEVIGIVHLLDNTKFCRVGIQNYNRDKDETTTGDSVHLDYAYTVMHSINDLKEPINDNQLSKAE